jgi:hypothetical protein
MALWDAPLPTLLPLILRRSFPAWSVAITAALPRFLRMKFRR